MSLLEPTASDIALQRRLLDSRSRDSFAFFIRRTFQTVVPGQTYQDNWHIQAIAWHLEQCATGGITRLIITVPPRYLKSICGSVAFPAWVLGQQPSRRIICASYSESLARKHSRDCRTVMQETWYRRIFPGTRLNPRKNTEPEFETTALGSRYATSVGGTLTGRGGDIIVIDDPLKPDEAMSKSGRSTVNEWFDSTLYSRLDDKRNGVIIVIMQRLHLEDLVGHVLQKEGPWVHLNLPVVGDVDQDVDIGPGKVHRRRAGELLHPARESDAVLTDIKSNLGSFKYSAQYQQCPVPAEGEIIKSSWFRSYQQTPTQEPGDRIVQSWDTASKAEEMHDYSVCTTWLVKGKDYYLLHVLRVKLLYPELKRAIIDQALAFGAAEIIIEDKGSGTQLIQDLQGEPGIPRPIAFKPDTDKVTRMSAGSARIEAGQVHLPHQASWLEDFRSELLQFPSGQYDDQVDSLSQFLACVERSPGNRWTVQLWNV
jgi:predicted phage terminase large subunit-like protein